MNSRLGTLVVSRIRSSRPLVLSGGVHALVLILTLGILFYPKNKKQWVEMQVIDTPPANTTAAPIKPQSFVPISRPKPPKADQRKVKPVFGLSKRAILDESASSQGESVKLGNTTAKDPDSEILDPKDADALPEAADEFLVSAMPVVLSEVRAVYPPLAKQKGIQGPVVMEVLIDAQGVVREVKVISGPGFGCEAAAQQAMRQFKFKPALIEGKSVAVRIRYTYRFELERL